MEGSFRQSTRTQWVANKRTRWRGLKNFEVFVEERYWIVYCVAVTPEQLPSSTHTHIGIIMKRIMGIPEFDRPREKMERKGPEALSNLELLAVLLGSGIKGKGVFEVARDILKVTEGKAGSISLEILRGIDGVGLAKASQIMAAIEFAKRLLVREDVRITSVNDALALTDELKDKKQEYFLTLTLDGASRLIQ
jgi:hypothetical protein